MRKTDVLMVVILALASIVLWIITHSVPREYVMSQHQNSQKFEPFLSPALILTTKASATTTKPASTNLTPSSGLIPNVAHFFRISHQPSLRFTEMLSIQSAFQFQKPEKVTLHSAVKPSGQWWLQLISNYELELETLPSNVSTERAKLSILSERGGGIIMDLDVIVVRSLDDLRRHAFVIGSDKTTRLDFGVIMANADSTFLKSLLNFNSSEEIISKSYPMAKKHQSVHIEPDALTFPDASHHYLLFNVNQHLRWWKQNYVVRFRFQEGDSDIYNPEYIKLLRTPVGEVLRLIQYGSSDVIDSRMPHIMYAKELNESGFLNAL
ncbi:hypothetical protein CAPTEDRAFT_207625 [Capitella teleta]|uniref:Alpha-1,4-N-acetylglucosaminyltransferase n=1 Tax=Capitella teleta TaxID=283909 RepID=R7TKX8_CAPTE|nr:hypothetical protein CAPTEDRAFT_207625 [Capitella teleta]|eukprot:ELT94483.1 hypothetical protein CAPTEDRAFT_207625 [Capitella teleta]